MNRKYSCIFMILNICLSLISLLWTNAREIFLVPRYICNFMLYSFLKSIRYSGLCCPLLIILKCVDYKKNTYLIKEKMSSFYSNILFFYSVIKGIFFIHMWLIKELYWVVPCLISIFSIMRVHCSVIRYDHFT